MYRVRSVRPSYIKLLDTVHHQGLQFWFGTFRTPRRVGMLKQTSLSLKTDVYNLVYSMQLSWRLILPILHTTVFIIL